MSFKIKLEPEVLDDIQEGITWYNKQKTRTWPEISYRSKSFF